MNKKTLDYTATPERNSYPLPTVHPIELEDWSIKLGVKTYVFWKQLYTLCNSPVVLDSFEITASLQDFADKLSISLSTLRRRIKELWEYGLIDLKEVTQTTHQSKNLVRLIIYTSPQNDASLSTEPLEKYRDWKRDFHSQNMSIDD